MTEDSLKFLEFNCDSPGGAYFTDIQTGLLAETAPMNALMQKYSFTHEPLVPRVLETLLGKYDEWGGARTNPTIAVVGNAAVTNVREFMLFGEYFERQGFNGFFTEPWDLEYDGNVLSHKGKPINIIYRRGVIDDLSKNVDRTKPLKAAIQDGNICVINPLRAKLGDNKNLLHLLSDDRMQEVLDDRQREYVRKHIPWTRVLREGSASYQGLTVDLFEYVSGNRDNFVIKPNSEYGGKGVVVGREADTKTWYETLEKSTSQRMVVQEYVPVPEEEYPVLEPDLHFEKKKVNHNFFVFDGSYVGGFARISDSTVINVSKGGGLVPFMVVED
jgi:glutathionylspermidine synthase